MGSKNQRYDIHDKDNQYSWFNTDVVYINANNTSLCGLNSNWKLPTWENLNTLVNTDSSTISTLPTINNSFFPNTLNDKYWTSTLEDSTFQTFYNAATIDFSNGSSILSRTTTEYYVRLVNKI